MGHFYLGLVWVLFGLFYWLIESLRLSRSVLGLGDDGGFYLFRVLQFIELSQLTCY